MLQSTVNGPSPPVRFAANSNGTPTSPRTPGLESSRNGGPTTRIVADAEANVPLWSRTPKRTRTDRSVLGAVQRTDQPADTFPVAKLQ